MISPLRVVVIDDDPTLRESLVDGLPLIGDFVVYQATDGAEGLRVIAEQQPDCVVVDVRMPHLDGFQFVRAMRGDPATAHIPLVILSALSQDGDRLAGLISGADIYLNKPILLDMLQKAIQDAVRLSQEERVQRTIRLGGGESA